MLKLIVKLQIFGSSPNLRFTFAAHFFRIPNARITGKGIGSIYLAMLKLSKDLWVCAPHNLLLGTFIGPKVSDSILKSCSSAYISI